MRYVSISWVDGLKITDINKKWRISTNCPLQLCQKQPQLNYGFKYRLWPMVDYEYWYRPKKGHTGECNPDQGAI